MSRFIHQLQLALAFGVVGPAIAHAQTSASGALSAAQAETQDLFARDRGASVLSHARPGYEALGLRAGAFTLFPRIQFDLERTDNVFAVSRGEQSDIVSKIKPEVSIESDWNRHSLRAYGQAVITRYQDFGSEDSEDWTLGAAGRLDVTRAATIDGGLEYASLTEPRTNSNTATASRDPISYDLTQAYLAGARARGRAKVSARADVRAYDYQDGRTLGGAVIDQDNRDRTISTGTLRGDYAISPATAVFVQASANSRDYDAATSPLLPARDSSGAEVLAGVNFEVGALAVGEVAVGYITQDFDAVGYKDIDGFGARAQLEWFPTQLTTVTFAGSRTIEDSGIAGSGGYLSSQASGRIDHELMRNVLLNGVLTWSNDEYDGIDRTDDRFQAAVGGTYLLNRTLGVSVTATHLEQSSSGRSAGADFSVNRLGVSLVAQF